MVAATIITVLLMILAAPAEATDSSAHRRPADLAPAVNRLVRQLDAQHLADRDRAEADLLRLGPAAIELLPAAGSHTSAETRLRLARIRRKLQEAQAQATARASRISFHGKNVPLSQFLAAVEQQTGNRIVDLREKFGQPKTDPLLTIDLEDAAFWQALDRVLDQAGMAVYPYAIEPAVGLVARSEVVARLRGGAAVYSGPLRIEPLAVIASRELGLGDTLGGSLQIKLQLSWEPRLSPISLRQPFAELKAVDENGRTLPVNRSGGALDVPLSSKATAVEMLLPLALPPREVKKIAALEGSIDAILPAQVTAFRFGNLTAARGVQKRVGEATVTFEGARRNGKLWEIAVSVRFDRPGDALESHRGWIFNNAAYLLAPDGTKIDHLGFETTRHTDDQVGLTYLFDLPGPLQGMTFVYETPTAILSTRFDYKIKDIRLP